MSKPPAKPKVSYSWRTEGRETIACCKLCGAHFYGYSRNAIYPSTKAHREGCPKVIEWRDEVRKLDLEPLL